MKFFEFEEGKIYVDEIGSEYRKVDDVAQYHSKLLGLWKPTTLTPYELYRLDFVEKVDEVQMEFDRLSNSQLNNVGFYDSLTIGMNTESIEDLASDNVYEIYMAIDGIEEKLTFDEFDRIVEYVNDLKALAKEVRK